MSNRRFAVNAAAVETDGMHRFEDARLDGWYWVTGRLVTLSFVQSLDEGKGALTSLLADWMERYDEIHVPTPSNRMRSICERRGFKPEMIFFPEYGEHGECLVWRKQ